MGEGHDGMQDGGPVTNAGGDAMLGRLFEDLVRDGWLLGMNAGLDPAMARMDAESGVYNAPYFEAVTQEAVADMERGREPRVGDGPERGAMAILSVRILDLDGLRGTLGTDSSAMLREIARRLETCLRADDVLGRTKGDTFSLLLRGCPPTMLTQISRRCVQAVSSTPISVGSHEVQPRVMAAAAQWEWGSANDILTASWAAIGAC